MTLPFATGDDPVKCALCKRETSLAMIATHLQLAHGIDLDDIADAPIYDATDPRDDA